MTHTVLCNLSSTVPQGKNYGKLPLDAADRMANGCHIHLPKVIRSARRLPYNNPNSAYQTCHEGIRIDWTLPPILSQRIEPDTFGGGKGVWSLLKCLAEQPSSIHCSRKRTAQAWNNRCPGIMKTSRELDGRGYGQAYK